MATTTNLSLPIITTGTESGTWGDLVDNGLTSYLDIAIAGGLPVAITTADVTLVNTAGTNLATNISTNTAQYAILNITGAKTAARSLILPAVSKWYLINNSAATGGYLLTVKKSGGTGITLVDGEKALVMYDGSDYIKVTPSLTSNGGLSSVSSVNNGPLAGTRNYMVNGGCQIAQRGNVTISSTASAFAGGADHIFVYAPGFTTLLGTIAQQTGITGGNSATGYGQGFTNITTTGSGSIIFSGRVEALMAANLNGKYVTVSMKVYHDVGTTLNATLTVAKANSINNFISVTTVAISNTITLTTGVYTPISFTALLGSVDGTNGVGFILSISLGAVSAKNIIITDVQFEQGQTVTPFEVLPITVITTQCLRYYYDSRTNFGGQPVTSTGIATSSNTIATNVAFPTQMLNNPTITLYSYNNTANKVSPFLVATDVGATVTAGVFNIGKTGFITVYDSGTSFTAGTVYMFGLTANSEI